MILNMNDFKKENEIRSVGGVDRRTSVAEPCKSSK